LKIDALFTATGIDTRADAANAEAAGYSGIWTSETKHDPFLAVALAAVETDRIGLGTSLVIAFARNPMSTAVQANDVQLLSKGRLLLGLGSQIKPHITRRFSMPWSHPAPRMREFILAMRAIWDCWNTGSKLDFRGDFYTHTLMTPFFNPGPNPYGPPAVLLAGVGEVMTAVDEGTPFDVADNAVGGLGMPMSPFTLLADRVRIGKLPVPDALIDWIVRQFDSRLVYLARHPGAVIESELRNNWKATFALDRFSATTGLPATAIAAHIDAAITRGWLEIGDNRIRASAFGRRFLNDVIAAFLPERGSEPRSHGGPPHD